MTRVLVVEDEVLLAMELAEHLVNAGAKVIVCAHLGRHQNRQPFSLPL